MNVWYVYQHKTLDTGEIFYIGIGCLSNYRRAFSKYSRSKFWKIITDKYGFSVEILKDKLTSEDAKILEKELILKYGRRDLKTGILCNLTDGGDGVFNLTQDSRKRISEAGKKRTHTEEVKKKISDAGKGRVFKDETKLKIKLSKLGKKRPEIGEKISNKLKGRTLSEETKKKMSESRRGRVFSEETKNKMRLSKIGNKYMLGKKLSEEAKNKIRISKLGSKNPMYGKTFSDETILKLKKSKSGENHPMYGKEHSAESKVKMSNSKKQIFKGCGNPFYGKTHSQETIKRILETRLKNKQLKLQNNGKTSPLTIVA
jgi:hypothetical protein